MVSLVRRLDDLLLQQMDNSVNPAIRAAAMLELLDGILMVPTHFPRDFLMARSPTSNRAAS